MHAKPSVCKQSVASVQRVLCVINHELFLAKFCSAGDLQTGNDLTLGEQWVPKFMVNLEVLPEIATKFILPHATTSELLVGLLNVSKCQTHTYYWQFALYVA